MENKRHAESVVLVVGCASDYEIGFEKTRCVSSFNWDSTISDSNTIDKRRIEH